MTTTDKKDVTIQPVTSNPSNVLHSNLPPIDRTEFNPKLLDEPLVKAYVQDGPLNALVAKWAESPEGQAAIKEFDLA
jgi:hypothetical protein